VIDSGRNLWVALGIGLVIYIADSPRFALAMIGTLAILGLIEVEGRLKRMEDKLDGMHGIHGDQSL
jgi:hypothetical protein